MSLDFFSSKLRRKHHETLRAACGSLISASLLIFCSSQDAFEQWSMISGHSSLQSFCILFNVSLLLSQYGVDFTDSLYNWYCFSIFNRRNTILSSAFSSLYGFSLTSIWLFNPYAFINVQVNNHRFIILQGMVSTESIGKYVSWQASNFIGLLLHCPLLPFSH